MASHNLDELPFVLQGTGKWCWAACLEMALGGRGDHLDQCEVANRRFNHLFDCCFSPDRTDVAKCNRGVSPSEFDHLLGDHNIPSVAHHRRLRYSEVQELLRAGYYIVAAWEKGINPAKVIC